MLQPLGSRWKGLGSKLAFPTAEIFETGNLGLTCRIWFAHSHEVNSVIVSFSPSPSKRILVFSLSSFDLVSCFCSPADTLSWLLQKRGEDSWAILLPLSCSALLAPPWCYPAVHCWYSFRYRNTTPVLSLMWSYLVFEDNESGIEVVLCSPFKTAEGQRSQTRTGGQRGQEKQRGERELNSSNFSCRVFLCVMTVWGSWG